MIHGAVLVLLAALGAGPTSSTVAIQIPATAELAGVTADELRTQLEKRLRKEKRLTVVPATDAPAYVLTVVSCLRGSSTAVEATATRERQTRRGGRETWTDQQMAIASQQLQRVELAIRLTWDDQFVEIASAREDLTLKDAVDAVVRQAVRRLPR
jgi:hypothetical protein